MARLTSVGRGARRSSKSRALWAYVATVDLAALLALVLLPAGADWHRWPVTLFLAAVTAGVACFSVRIPAIRSEMAPTHPFVLLALAAVGARGAWLVALAGVLGSLPRGRASRSLQKFAFNLGAVPLSTAVAAGAFAALGGRPGQELLLLLAPLTSAALTLFLVNTGLVAAAVSLDRRRSLLATWGGSFLWTVIPCLGGLSMTVAMYAVIDLSIGWVLLIGAPPSWLLVEFYQARARRFADGAPPETTSAGETDYETEVTLPVTPRRTV